MILCFGVALLAMIGFGGDSPLPIVAFACVVAGAWLAGVLKGIRRN